jgi:hypothetical protein
MAAFVKMNGEVTVEIERNNAVRSLKIFWSKV